MLDQITEAPPIHQKLSENPYTQLLNKFPTAGAQKDYDCFKNAIHNTVLAILNNQHPQIYEVVTDKGKHAYISLSGNVRSNGFTWTTDFYPELTLEQIKNKQGREVARELLSQALNPDTDTHGYHRVLDNLEKTFPNLKTKIADFINSPTPPLV